MYTPCALTTDTTTTTTAAAAAATTAKIQDTSLTQAAL